MRWTLSQKQDFSLYGYKFDKYEGWTCTLMSLDVKHDMCTYLVSYSAKWKYWNVPCRENKILSYMVTILINMKVELAPWFKTWYLNLFSIKFGKMKVLKWPLLQKNEILAYGVTSLINGKFEVVPQCPFMRNMIFEPIFFNLVNWTHAFSLLSYCFSMTLVANMRF